MSKDGGNLTVQYNLRWSEELRDKIAAIAKDNTRSMNQEIIARLEESFSQNKAQSDDFESLKKEIRNLNMTVYTLAEALANK